LVPFIVGKIFFLKLKNKLKKELIMNSRIMCCDDTFESYEERKQPLGVRCGKFFTYKRKYIAFWSLFMLIAVTVAIPVEIYLVGRKEFCRKDTIDNSVQAIVVYKRYGVTSYSWGGHMCNMTVPAYTTWGVGDNVTMFFSETGKCDFRYEPSACDLELVVFNIGFGLFGVCLPVMAIYSIQK